MARLVHAGWSGYGAVLRSSALVGGGQFLLEKPLLLVYRLFLTPFWPLSSEQLPGLRVQIALVSLGVLALLVWWYVRVRRTLRGGSVLPLLLAPALVLTVFYLYVRWFWQVWHHAPLLVALLVGSLAGVSVVRLTAPRLVIIAVVLTALTLGALRTCYFWPQQTSRLLWRAQHFHDESKQRLRIGVTDSGYLGYFSRHEIINLDGVVNNRAAEALRKRELSRYIDANAIDLVEIDSDRWAYYGFAPKD